jgi:hypothetical protein
VKNAASNASKPVTGSWPAAVFGGAASGLAIGRLNSGAVMASGMTRPFDGAVEGALLRHTFGRAGATFAPAPEKTRKHWKNNIYRAARERAGSRMQALFAEPKRGDRSSLPIWKERTAVWRRSCAAFCEGGGAQMGLH